MSTPRASFARLLRHLQRFAGIMLVVAGGAACAPISNGDVAGTTPGVAAIAPQILKASFVPGAREFCSRNPRDCQPSAIVTLSLSQEEQVLEINQAVNHALTWTAPEIGPKGRTNIWHILADGGNGPCADFAATKFDRLLQAGLPAGAFSFALVHVDGDPASILHLVLVANFRDGLYVLDSRDDRLWRPQEVRNYAWLSYSSFGEPALWRAGVPNADPNDLTGSDALRLAEDVVAPHPSLDPKSTVVVAASRTAGRGYGFRARSGRRRIRIGMAHSRAVRA